MSFKEIFWVPFIWVLSRTPLSFFFSTAIEVERSEPSVEPGTIIPKGLGIHVFINFGNQFIPYTGCLEQEVVLS